MLNSRPGQNWHRLKWKLGMTCRIIKTLNSKRNVYSFYRRLTILMGSDLLRCNVRATDAHLNNKVDECQEELNTLVNRISILYKKWINFLESALIITNFTVKNERTKTRFHFLSSSNIFNSNKYSRLEMFS